MNGSNDNAQSVIDAIAAHYEAIIKLLGEDSQRQGLLKTPQRAAKALYYATNGYRVEVDSLVNDAVFTHDGSQLVMVKDIEFYSFCEHHILPFFGHISIGYVPGDKIIGLSKVARIVDMFSRRLQVQERLCQQVCDTLSRVVGAKGVMVVCNAEHLCMKMRGVEKQNSSTTTTACTGVFEHDPSLRHEFMQALRYK